METTISHKTTQYKMPLGQRLLAAGYKKITGEQLEERFCCDAITKKINQKIKDDFIERVKKYKHSDQISSDVVNGYSYCWVSNKRFGWQKKDFIRGKWYKQCSIKTIPLESYVEEVIPERVLQSIEKATEIGIKDFEVAFPIIEEVKQSDPVVLGILNSGKEKIYIEIDCWE